MNAPDVTRFSGFGGGKKMKPPLTGGRYKGLERVEKEERPMRES